VSISSPVSGATVSGAITVTATASDNVAVASVQFQVDGTNLGAAVTTAPYSKSLSTTTLANGTHTLTAIATDTSNNKATSAAVSITVNNTSSTLPTVSITSPVSGAVVSGTVTISASASASSGIANVQFQVDGLNLGVAVTTAPYSQSWNTTTAAAGSHTLTAVATPNDTSLQPVNTSVPVTVANNLATGGAGWTKLTGTTLKGGSENATPCPANNFNGYGYSYADSCQNVYNAWNSAVADLNRNRLIIWGGGHADYGGNEIYSLELSTKPQELIRLDPPSPPNNTTNCVETLADGRPNSRHTYDGIVYMPNADQMVSFGGSLNYCGFFSGTAWTLQMSSVGTSCAPNCSATWTNVGSIRGDGYSGSYDANSGLAWFLERGGAGNFYSYNPTGPLITLKSTVAVNDGGTALVDPVHQYFMYLGVVASEPNGILYTSIASGSTFTWSKPTPIGSCPALGGASPAAIWDPIDKVVVIYAADVAANQLTLLDPATWTCTTETYGSTQGTDYPQSNPRIGSGGFAATNHHFNYFPSLDVYALCNDPENDCWLLHRKRKAN